VLFSIYGILLYKPGLPASTELAGKLFVTTALAPTMGFTNGNVWHNAHALAYHTLSSITTGPLLTRERLFGGVCNEIHQLNHENDL
jgi:hypothetical protein